MKAQPACLACCYRQALNTARIATGDPSRQLAIIERMNAHYAKPDFDQTPAAFSQAVYRIVAEETGVADPYAGCKRTTNQAALAQLPMLGQLVADDPDPLSAAIHLAVAGNIIDLGIGHAFDLEHDIRPLLTKPFAGDAYADFRAELAPGCRILYLGDNAGEIVFDRVLVEHLLAAGATVTFVVKSGPIINDATREDANACGLDRLVPVIETGSDDIGVHWDHVSAPFRRAFRDADLVLGKGHGNFETCTGRPGNFYFLLKAKCDIVATELGVSLGDLVFRHEHNGATTD